MCNLNEPKDAHYLPHLTWPEVDALRRRTDVAILPFGAISSTGRRLPIGTDTLGVIAVARAAAARRATCYARRSCSRRCRAHHVQFPRDDHADRGDVRRGS